MSNYLFQRFAPGLPLDAPKGTPPHVTTFAGVLNTINRLYSQRFDEALKNSKEDALAMRRDCYIRSLLNERKRPTAQREWYISCQDPQDKVQRQICDMATLALRRFPKMTTFRFALLEAVWYGRFGAQIQWKKQVVNGQEWTIPYNWRPVNGDKIAFDFDLTPAIAVNPIFARDWKEYIIFSDTLPFLKLKKLQWRRQFVIHSHEVEDSDYSDIIGAGAIGGVGVRGQIYWAWWLRDECLSWAVNFMQKLGTLGILIFWYQDGNASAKEAAEEAASRANNENVLVFPRPMGSDKETWGVQSIQPTSAGVETLRNLISDYFEKHIERLIIGQSLSGGNPDGSGGAGIAALHRDTKFQILSFDTYNLDETLTSDLLRPMIAINVPDVDPALFSFRSILPDPAQAEAMRNLTLVWDRVPVPLSEVYRISGVRKPEANEDVVPSAQEQEMQQQQQLQAQQGGGMGQVMSNAQGQEGIDVEGISSIDQFFDMFQNQSYQDYQGLLDRIPSNFDLGAIKKLIGGS